MATRSELRRIAMTCLYQINIYEDNNNTYDIDEVIKENIEINNDFVKELVNGVVTNINELDDIANKYLSNWKISRLDKMGATILRMAIYELKYMDTPPIVVINEAVELAKTYTDEELAKMINAALDKYIKE